MISTVKIWVALVAVAIIALMGWFLPILEAGFGGTTNYDSLDVSDGYQVDGSTVIDGDADCLILGDSADTDTVYITVSDSTVTASTTAPAACQ